MPKPNWIGRFAFWLTWAVSLAPLTTLAKPVFTSPAATTFLAGVFSTFNVTVTTSSGIAKISRKSGTLPKNLKFVDNHNNTATISGTPALNAGGNYTLKLIASAGGKTTQIFVLTVAQPVTITSAATTACAVGVACAFTVTTTGSPVPTIVRAGTLPAAMSFVDLGNGKGTLSGTPAGGSQGSYPLTFTASNGIGPPAVQNFTLTVNSFLAFTSVNNKTCVVGAQCTFAVTASGQPLPSIARSGGVLPAGMTYVAGPNGSGTLSGMPSAGTGGIHALQFTAHNGVEPDAVQDFTLTINQPPKITSVTTLGCAINSLCNLTVTTTGFPVPSILNTDTLPVDITFFDNGDGTGSLGGIAEAGTDGVYALTFTAANGVGTDAVQNFTLTVNPSLAITSDDNTACTVGVACSFTVTTSGVPAPSIARSGAALPSLLTFVDNGDGTGTLAGTAAAGTAGDYLMTFTAANGVETNAVQPFTLTVNQVPAFTSVASATCAAGFPCAFTVVTTGSPPAGLEQSGDSLPPQMTFFDNGDGTGALSGAPNSGTSGAYHLIFTANNDVGPPVTQDFTLTVTSGPSEPLGPSAMSGNAQATVSFSPPDNSGSSPITGYTVTCTPTSGAPVTAPGSASPITVAGLTNGATYTCTVHATNSNGDGPESVPTNPVTPSSGAPATAALTVTVGGSGTGTVTSVPAGIACPGDCSESYVVGTGVVLTAQATGGSVFTGWLGGCTGIGTCIVTMNAAATVSATFAAPATLATLDIDLSGSNTKYNALTDGVLVLRYLFGLTGTALTNGALGTAPGRATGAAIQAYLDDIRPALDVDGNGQVDAPTDGLLILRALFGYTGNALTDNALGANPSRGTAAAILNYIDTLKP